MLSEGLSSIRRWRAAAAGGLTVALTVSVACAGRHTASTAPNTVPPPATTAAGGAAPILQPGAPGHETRAISSSAATDLSRVGFTPADVQFMQGMIGHHAQAVEMVALLKTRTEWHDMQLLGQRIEASQIDEMKMMRDWLQARGQAVPGENPGGSNDHAHHMHDATLMPGMLTPEQMDALAAAKGKAFDRLFLDGMIRHHQGALTMVKALLAAPGAAQDSEIFAFASDVEADQQMEIDRMGGMLNALGELSR